METIGFDSHGVRCEAWYVDATSPDLTDDRGRPCVVMAHGFGTTRDSGLLPFAERFAAAGCDVLLFDYRGFGGSDGTPRQDVDHRRHREDYHAAVAAARARDGVDPDRVAVWGTSYSGGHVIVVAADDPRIRAVVSQGAAMDGRAAVSGRGKPAPTGAKSGGGAKGRALAAAVARDLARAATRRTPHVVPFLGPPDSGALMSGPGAADFEAMTGPSFRNEMCARGLLRIAFNRPVRRAAEVACPTLLVVAEQDEIAPAASVHEVAGLIGERAEVVSFDCRHFAIYQGEVFERSVTVQAEFLRRVLV